MDDTAKGGLTQFFCCDSLHAQKFQTFITLVDDYRPNHCVKFSESSGDLLEYNGSQGANGLD